MAHRGTDTLGRPPVAGRDREAPRGAIEGLRLTRSAHHLYSCKTIVKRVQSPERLGLFLGVRLSSEEAEALDRWVRAGKFRSRSDAVRHLIRGADPEALVPTSGSPKKDRPGPGTVPVSLMALLEEMVEDGWANSLDDALSKALDRGLTELAVDHGERLRKAREIARELRDRRTARRKASNRGERLLGT